MEHNNGKSALGRGINALFDDNRSDSLNISRNQIVDLNLSDIDPNVEQPRREFDLGKLEELADSIKKDGVYQPILVRKVGDRYHIIAGERRYRASKIANKQTIPAIIRDVDEDTSMIMAIVENLQREDLTPLEEAMCYQKLIDTNKCSQENVAQLVSKSRSYVANHLRLLKLPKVLQEMLSLGQISMGHAKVLVGKDNALHIAKMIFDKGLNVRQVEELIRKQSNGVNKEKVNISKQIHDDKELSRLIVSTLDIDSRKFKVKCTTTGAVIIEFPSHEVFLEIIQNIKHN